MPSASFSHAASVSASVEVVWATLQEAETWELIGPLQNVWDAEHDAHGRLLRYRWSAVVGPTTYRGTSVVTESQRPTVMALALDSSEVAGVLTTRLAMADRNTSLDVSLAITSKGPLASLFFPVVAAAIGNGLPQQVDAFAASFEQ
ncbi:MAG TPA: SRPBCC family protein [Acidimicrobiia bacterium]|jgi:hypothetical protein